MLVTFVSSETGELLMYAEVAGPLLRAMGKETTRRGTFTPFEMLPAAEALRAAVARGEGGEVRPEAEEEDSKVVPVSTAARAWPLIDMLERTAKSGDKDAHIVWEAAADF